MNVSNALLKRRSIRHYDTRHELTDNDLRHLLTAAALSPTSFNMQNRHVVAVRNPETKSRLQEAAFGQQHLGDCSVVLVIAGVLAAHRNTARTLRNAPAPVREMFEPMVEEFYEGKDQLQRDEACRSVGLAAMSLMLRAQELGYESCPVIGFDPERVSQILGLDKRHPPLLILTIGKGNAPAPGRLGLLDFEELVSLDHFDNRAITGEIDA